LLVDDDPSVRTITRLFYRRQGDAGLVVVFHN